jgi:16S rRNA (uracil1498-N3)-methyltransferase
MTRQRATLPETSTERFFLPQSLQLTTLELDGTEAHHLLHVLRAKVGDHIGLFNGEGDEAQAEIIQSGKRSAKVRVVETWTTPAETGELILATALPKGDRVRWLVEKATELGVSRIIPLRTARSVVEPREGKIDKLEQTVIAACKQCGRSRLLRLSSLTSFTELLRSINPEQCHTMIAHPEVTMSIGDALRQVAESSSLQVLIGPEGGFTNEELSAAIAAGVRPISLGRLILRIETAVIAIAAAWRMSRTGGS